MRMFISSTCRFSFFRVFIVSFCAIMAASACRYNDRNNVDGEDKAADPYSIQSGPDTLLSVMTMSNEGFCRSKIEGESPAQFESGNFQNRVVDGLVNSSLNIDCITHQFSMAEIEYWSERMDPVAMYVKAIVEFESIFNKCSDAELAEKAFRDAFQVGVRTRGANLASRVPEAYLAIGVIKKRCGNAGGDEYYFNARENGIDPVEFFGGAY